jgi:hypothetical protein
VIGWFDDGGLPRGGFVKLGWVKKQSKQLRRQKAGPPPAAKDDKQKTNNNKDNSLQGKPYIPTLRKCAKDGAPERLWLVLGKQATAKAKRGS